MKTTLAAGALTALMATAATAQDNNISPADSCILNTYAAIAAKNSNIQNEDVKIGATYSTDFTAGIQQGCETATGAEANVYPKGDITFTIGNHSLTFPGQP